MALLIPDVASQFVLGPGTSDFLEGPLCTLGRAVAHGILHTFGQVGSRRLDQPSGVTAWKPGVLPTRPMVPCCLAGYPQGPVMLSY